MAETRHRLRFPWLSSSKSENAETEENRPEAVVAVGRVIGSFDESKIAENSAILAKMIFGRHLDALPEWWRDAPAYGIISDQLEKVTYGPRSIAPLQPGWGYAVAREIDAQFFVIETAALEQGTWAGTLEPGGEHLFDELLAMINDAHRNLVTPILVESTVPDSEAPRTFSLASSLTRLRKAVPGTVESIGYRPHDLFSPKPSPLIQTLIEYETQVIR